MEYFLTILFNSFKLWEYTDAFGNHQLPEIGAALMMWLVSIFLVYGVYSAFKNSQESVQFAKKCLSVLTILIGLYGFTLIFAAAGGDIPANFRFQFISNGISAMSSNIFWGVFSYFLILLSENISKRRNKKTEMIPEIQTN